MVDPPTDRRTTVLALSASVFFLVLAATYALLRARDVVFGTEPNPATVMYMYSAHIALFWRAAIGAFVGGFAGLLTAWLAPPRLETTTRLVVGAIPVVAVLVALQAVLLP